MVKAGLPRLKTRQEIIENAVRLMTYWHNHAKNNLEFIEKAYQIANKEYDDVKTDDVKTNDWRTRGVIE
jgi:hypothetical protein